MFSLAHPSGELLSRKRVDGVVQLALIFVNPRVSSICIPLFLLWPPSRFVARANTAVSLSGSYARTCGVKVNALSRRDNGTGVARRSERRMVNAAIYPASLTVNTWVSCIYDTDQYPIPILLCAGSDPDPGWLRHYGLRSATVVCTHACVYVCMRRYVARRIRDKSCRWVTINARVTKWRRFAVTWSVLPWKSVSAIRTLKRASRLEYSINVKRDVHINVLLSSSTVDLSCRERFFRAFAGKITFKCIQQSEHGRLIELPGQKNTCRTPRYTNLTRWTTVLCPVKWFYWHMSLARNQSRDRSLFVSAGNRILGVRTYGKEEDSDQGKRMMNANRRQTRMW